MVDLLNVLCLYFVKFLEEGEIVFFKIGWYCCVKVVDLFEYKKKCDIDCFDVLFDFVVMDMENDFL